MGPTLLQLSLQIPHPSSYFLLFPWVGEKNFPLRRPPHRPQTACSVVRLHAAGEGGRGGPLRVDDVHAALE